MAYGQGAAAALPIAALFMQKVYADDKLPYSPEEKFHFPPGFDLCSSGYVDDGDGEEILEMVGEVVGEEEQPASQMNDLMNY